MEELNPQKEEYSYTPGRSLEAVSMRVCILCHSPISNAELKKGDGAWIPAGVGQFSCHQSCLDEINTVIEDQKQREQEANEAAQFVRDLARTAQQAIRKHH